MDQFNVYHLIIIIILIIIVIYLFYGWNRNGFSNEYSRDYCKDCDKYRDSDWCIQTANCCQSNFKHENCALNGCYSRRA